MSEEVNHPKHYGGDTPYEAIKVIEVWGLSFNPGNAVKYLARCGRKTKNPLSDLKKALWYIEREIKLLEWESHEDMQHVEEARNFG